MYRILGLLGIVATAVFGLATCGETTRGAVSFSQYLADLQAVHESVAASTGYPAEDIDVSGNYTSLRISILVVKLADVGQAEREKVARAVVVAAERAFVAHPEMSTVQAIWVAIFHPGSFGAPYSEWHIEDVIEFRRSPDGKFH